LEWFVNAGGLGLVVAWMMVAISFVMLRKKHPGMDRPFKLSGGTSVGWIAILMSIVVAILYMPGMSSALVWPYEWVIVGIWAILGLILYKISMIKYGTAHADKRMKEEIDRVS